MDYPLIFLVKDTQGNVLFKSQDKEQALKWGRRLEKMRTTVAGYTPDPLCLVQSQFVGFIDEL